jgi:histidine triad (HIT) family protein
MTAGCPFCAIAARKVAAHVVHEDDRVLAFLDRGPIRPGHTQIMPKAHFPYFDDVPADVITSIVLFGQSLAVAMKRLYGVPRVAFLFTGGDIAHAHAHVVPMREKTDITSRRYIAEEKLTFRGMPLASESDLAQSAAELRRVLSGAR